MARLVVSMPSPSQVAGNLVVWNGGKDAKCICPKWSGYEENTSLLCKLVRNQNKTDIWKVQSSLLGK